MIYGVMGAMPEEVRLLTEQLTQRSTRRVADVEFVSGIYEGRRVVACCAGMGKVNAAAAAQILISVFGVQRLIFSGIAGNMSKDLSVGDVVISTTLCHHDIDDFTYENTGLVAHDYTADPQLVATAAAACRALGLHALCGRIATGEKFIGDSAVKADIAARCHPLCVEMEGAAVAQVAEKNGVPFVVIRTVSDNADEAALEKLVVRQFDVTEYCNTAAAIVQQVVRLQ